MSLNSQFIFRFSTLEEYFLAQILPFGKVNKPVFNLKNKRPLEACSKKWGFHTIIK